MNQMKDREKTTHIVIHCSDSTFGDVDTIREWHKARGWLDIGYHFVILNGRIKKGQSKSKIVDCWVEHGRDIKKVGSHCKAKGLNHVSIGICLIGKKYFSKQQLKELKELIKHLQSVYDIPIQNIIGHREADNSKTCPNWDVGIMRDYLSSKSRLKRIFKKGVKHD